MLERRAESCPKCESTDLSRHWSAGRDYCRLQRQQRGLAGGAAPCQDVGRSEEHLEVYCRGCHYVWNEETADTPQLLEVPS